MEEKDFKKVIRKIVKVLAQENVTYNNTKHIFSEVRKQLQLSPGVSKKGTKERLSREQLKAFLDTAFCTNIQRGVMMRTLYETGARLSEFTAFTIDDLYVRERRMVIKKGKGQKRREVPITGELVNLILAFLRGRTEGPLFRSQRKGKFSNRRVQQIVDEIALLSKIPIKISPHILRATRGTILVEDGISKEWVQQFYGHEKPDTTEVYVRTARMDLDREFREKASDYNHY